ncbi:MAG TPA: hypothetical protein VH619_20605 [Verrucomicrobiae bacterium]|jgi:hypothetical protein|nr:hypothetical protein [Verrucomicrobiae bacterium]
MGLDIRWAIGIMFSLIGVLLLVYGLATNSDTEMYRHSLGTNINIIWGVVQLIFGGGMLLGAVRGRKTPPKA